MLAAIVRGIFLVGVLALYSTSVWKMIDGYFKDRFQNYLQDEFKRNPRMRDDLNAYAAAKAGKAGIDLIDEGNSISAPVENRRLEESLGSETGSVDVLTTAASFLENVDRAKESGENRVKASVDNDAFQEFLGMQTKREEKSETSGSQVYVQDQSAVQRDKEKMKRDEGKMEKQKLREKKETVRVLRGKRSILESEGNAARSKKRKFKQITFTEADFRSVKKLEEGDFSEFDVLDDETTIVERKEGILVSELPFKPKFDIGELEVVNADEFCPLTLEDEATCGIPSKWP